MTAMMRNTWMPVCQRRMQLMCVGLLLSLELTERFVYGSDAFFFTWLVCCTHVTFVNKFLFVVKKCDWLYSALFFRLLCQFVKCAPVFTSWILYLYYRKRGSASYIVREWLLWERERDACDVIRYHAEIASDHAYDYLDGASTQRVDAFWACRVFMH